jgi:hypothetical protein
MRHNVYCQAHRAHRLVMMALAVVIPVGLAFAVLALGRMWNRRPADPAPFWTETSLPVASGGVLEVGYCRAADSGAVLVLRDRPGGRALWEGDCAPLGVAHSEYEHEVTVRVEGPVVWVTSRGSAGTFVEEIELSSGTCLSRVARLNDGWAAKAEPQRAPDRGGRE